MMQLISLMPLNHVSHRSLGCRQHTSHWCIHLRAGPINPSETIEHGSIYSSGP